MSPPPLAKVSTSTDVAPLALKDFCYANFLTRCELKNLNTMHIDLTASKELECTDQLRDLFQERSSMLYHDISEAVKCSEVR